MTDPHASLIARLNPQRDLLLVRQDVRTHQLGGGLVAPQSATELHLSRVGTVVKAGPLSPYRPGERIAYYAFTKLGDEATARVAGSESTWGAVGLLPSTEVLCVFAVDEAMLPSPLSDPELGVATAHAPYGCLLVERSTIPTSRGGVVYTDTSVGAVRSAEARVHDVHPSSATPNVPGDLVLLASSVGRNITFGITGARVLSVVMPSQVMCDVVAPPSDDENEVEPDNDVDSLLAGAGVKRVPHEDGAKWDEGDRRAPQ